MVRRPEICRDHRSRGETRGKSELVGVVIAEGRAASGGRREVFAPGAAEWPRRGIEILPEHRGQVETTTTPERAANGEIRIRAKLTMDCARPSIRGATG